MMSYANSKQGLLQDSLRFGSIDLHKYELVVLNPLL